MKTILGTWKNGQLEFDGPPNWPDGCRVSIEPITQEETLGMREEDWPTTPEGIAQVLAQMDQVEPLEMTPEEEADLAAWRKKIKEYTIEKMEKRLDGLFP
jgi:hypothetical protein